MLLRYDPFQDVERQVDRLLRSNAPALPIDAYQSDEQIVVELDIPGVDPSTIDVTVERSVIRVSADRVPPYGEDATALVAERRHGHFTRTLTLSTALDSERLTAEYVDGVLRLTVPVADAARPRRVDVTAGGSSAISVGETQDSSQSGE